jgi:hypothetical protein
MKNIPQLEHFNLIIMKPNVFIRASLHFCDPYSFRVGNYVVVIKEFMGVVYLVKYIKVISTGQI